MEYVHEVYSDCHVVARTRLRAVRRVRDSKIDLAIFASVGPLFQIPFYCNTILALAI